MTIKVLFVLTLEDGIIVGYEVREEYEDLGIALKSRSKSSRNNGFNPDYWN